MRLLLQSERQHQQLCTPAPCAACLIWLSRSREYSSVSCSKHSRVMPHSRHSAGSTSAGFPLSTSRSEPRAMRLLRRSAGGHQAPSCSLALRIYKTHTHRPYCNAI